MELPSLKLIRSLPHNRDRLWHAEPWGVESVTAAGKRRISPALPFALVGSHPSCQIRLPDQSLPDVVCLVCVFGSQVEVTPLVSTHPISVEASYGGASFHVGRNRITVDVQEPGSGSLGWFPTERPDLELTYLNRCRRLRLQRRLTLMGAERPCSLRLRLLGLRPCQGALIVVHDDLWYLSLCPADHAIPRVGATWQDLSDAPYQVGEIGIRRLPRPAPSCVDRSGAAARRHISATRVQEGGLVLAKSKSKESKKGRRQTPSSCSIDPDLLTAQITRRTQSLGRWRWLKQRFFWGAVIALTTALSTYTIIEILKAVRRRNLELELDLPWLTAIREWFVSYL